MSVDVAAIRARLEAFRDLPWSWRVTDDRRWAVVEDANGDRRAQVNDDDVAEFIAHAPADVAALLAEVERLNMTAGVLRSHLESLWEELFENAAVSHEARMKRALGVLRSALEGEQAFVNAFEQVREDRARAEAERDTALARLAKVEALAADGGDYHHYVVDGPDGEYVQEGQPCIAVDDLLAALGGEGA